MSRARAARTERRRQERAAAKAQRVPYRRPHLYREQEDAIFHPARYVVIEASTKTGKTTGCIAWLTEQGVRYGYEGWNGFWVAPIYKQAEIAYYRLKRFARDWVEPNDSKLWLTLPNGARLMFKGANDPDSLYGDDCHAGVLDESTRMKEASFVAMRSQLTATGGPLRIIGNVKGSKNWAFKLGRRAKAGAANMHYAKLTCWHAVAAGIMTVQEVLDAQSMLATHTFQELYLAEASEDGSNPFGLKNIERCCVRDTALIGAMRALEPVVWGIDLAKSVNWTVAIGLNVAGDVCRFERWQAPWRESLPRIRRLVGSTPAVIDSTGVGNPIVEFLQSPTLFTQASAGEVKAALEAEQLLRDERELAQQVAAALTAVTAECPNIIGYGFTQQSKQMLMEALAIDIQTHAFRFPPGGEGVHAEVLRDELDAFEFEHTRTGVRYSAPEGQDDDSVMALGLARHGYRNLHRYTSAGGALITL